MLGEGRETKLFVFIPVFMEGLSKTIYMKMPLDNEPMNNLVTLHNSCILTHFCERLGGTHYCKFPYK